MTRRSTRQQSENTIGGNVIGSNIQMSGGKLRIGGRIADSRIDGDVVGDQVIASDGSAEAATGETL